MAIPPKEGHYTVEDFQLKVDEAKANIQWIESKLAEFKAHPELAKNFVKDLPRPDVGLPTPEGTKGRDDAKLGDKDKDRDKPAYGLGSSKK